MVAWSESEACYSGPGGTRSAFIRRYASPGTRWTRSWSPSTRPSVNWRSSWLPPVRAKDESSIGIGMDSQTSIQFWWQIEINHIPCT